MSIGIGYEQLTILIVEDEAHTRAIIKAMLRQIGVRSIVEAANVKDGLNEVLRTRPHIVLCDVHMEPIDGLTFLKTLRAVKIQALRETPVLFLTADAQKDTVLFAREHKVDGYMVKPVAMGDLKARIDQIMRR
jgi:two-component system chemotaxis response regulator CheY